MTLRVLSLGGGVQSTTLALMAAAGEIEAPDVAIFADTGWEPVAVYHHLDRLEAELPFPVHRVSGGDIRGDIVSGETKRSGSFTPVPWYIINADGTEGIGKRECTAHYKLEPIRREIASLVGRKTAGAVELWIGISVDEAHRMRPSGVNYIVNRWPLIERGMNRGDCRAWLVRHGWTEVPKSSCIGCPFHSDEHWLALSPEEFANAVLVDAAIRDQAPDKGRQYMHRSLLPLDRVDFSRRDPKRQPDLFGNECLGMCGV